MNKRELVVDIIGEIGLPQKSFGDAFAPSNIALCKYWGKRIEGLNLPVTSSLSISLGDQGTHTRIEVSNSVQDSVYLNDQSVVSSSQFYNRLVDFLDLIRPEGMRFKVSTKSNIPIGAGVASSASGFAALTRALDALFAWSLSDTQLSILARLGSGSACRSLWHGFVEWEAGKDDRGLDSYARPLSCRWPELRIGLLLFSTAQKEISSRKAMAATVKNCAFYDCWPDRVQTAIDTVKAAIMKHDFTLFGQAAERNALEMHALMLATTPPVIYSNADTIAAMKRIWEARENGLELYFTQDAGPNLKLLFLEEDRARVKELFPEVTIVTPW